MSGVTKDDPGSTPKVDSADGASLDVVDASPDSSPDTIASRDAASREPSDGEPRATPARRAASHLRVVADNAAASEASGEVADTPGRRIGAVIRVARENLGLELEQVSRETRIHLSHLRAIEDMTPSLLGAPVYAKGYIRNYARHLKLDPDATLTRYLAECAILADPEKQDIAPPTNARKLPVALPVLGILIIALIGGAVAFAIFGGEDAPETTVSGAQPAVVASVDAPGPAIAATPLRIVAVTRARIEVRGSDGTKFLARFFSPGESYSPRVGAGWTVTTTDGAAFEWRLGEASLGLLAAEGGPVYAQSVDLALTRQPVVTQALPVPDAGVPEIILPSPTDANVRAAPPSVSVATPPRPRAQPRALPPAETAASAPIIGTPPVAMPTETTPPPAAVTDPSILAYPAN